MLGAIIGGIVGSVYEWNNIKTKDFPLFNDREKMKLIKNIEHCVALPLADQVKYQDEQCPIYDCAVNKRGYKTCGECAEVPCQLFYDWKDPSMSDEEHNKAIESNVSLLKELNSTKGASDE